MRESLRLRGLGGNQVLFVFLAFGKGLVNGLLGIRK